LEILEGEYGQEQKTSGKTPFLMAAFSKYLGEERKGEMKREESGKKSSSLVLFEDPRGVVRNFRSV